MSEQHVPEDTPEDTPEVTEQGHRDVGKRAQWRPTPALIDSLNVIKILVTLIGTFIIYIIKVFRDL